jgi:hypothetical protein
MKLRATERGMAKVGLQRAAELTGKSRSTIHRAMNAGRLSYEKNESGERLIDVSELLYCTTVMRQAAASFMRPSR